MHILICDDDAVFAARVETLVRDFFARRGLQVECTVCHSGEETLARRDLDLYQVALLDVDLDTMNGISLGKQLRQCSPEICLVYVSAYLEFAPEGYTVNAFRYILKRDLDCQLPRCLDAILHEQDHRAPKTLTIRQNRTETELPYDSIYYLESDLRKINVYGDVAHQPLCSYYGKLNELPQALFENGFLRVGRSAVVNMKYIRQISSYMVTLRNGVKLGVSRNDHAFLGRGRRFRFPCLWAALLAAVFLAASIRHDIGFFNIGSVILNVIYLLVTVLFFGGSWNQKLSACLVNGIMCLLTENTVSYTFAWCKHIPVREVWRYRSCLFLLVAAVVGAGLLAAYIIRRWRREQALTPLQMLVMSFFPGIVVVLNIVLMVSGGSEVPSMMNMMLTFGLTIAVLIHLGIVQMVNDQMLQQQTLMVEAVRQKKSAEALLESYKTQRRLTHEFTNHTDALALLLQQGDYEGAKAYLSTLTKTIAANTTIMNTHNPLLDALLSKKYEEASRKGVMVYFDLPDLRDMPMGQTDLVIVLSNLLNNAIEAAAQADPPEVYVRMRKSEDEVVLSVRNRVEKDLNLVDGQLPRISQKGAGHGFGLWNVRDVLKKYGGEYTISCRECWFRFTCTIPLRKL